MFLKVEILRITKSDLFFLAQLVYNTRYALLFHFSVFDKWSKRPKHKFYLSCLIFSFYCNDCDLSMLGNTKLLCIKVLT